MKRYQRSPKNGSGTITDVGLATAERVRLCGDILIALANAVAANEQAQRRFRAAVMVKLSKVETMVSMIHGAQIVQAQGFRPGYEESARKQAEAAEKFVSERSHSAMLKAVRFIYGEEETAAGHWDRRRKWSDWEI